MQFNACMPTSSPSSMGAGDGWTGWNGGWKSVPGGPSASGPYTPGAGPPRGAGPVKFTGMSGVRGYRYVCSLRNLLRYKYK